MYDPYMNFAWQGPCVVYDVAGCGAEVRLLVVYPASRTGRNRVAAPGLLYATPPTA